VRNSIRSEHGNRCLFLGLSLRLSAEGGGAQRGRGVCVCVRARAPGCYCFCGEREREREIKCSPNARRRRQSVHFQLFWGSVSGAIKTGDWVTVWAPSEGEREAMATAAAVASASVTLPCCTSSLVAAISSTSSAQTLLPARYSTSRVSLLKSGGSQKVKRNPLSEDIICFSIISSPKSLSLSLSLRFHVWFGVSLLVDWGPRDFAGIQKATLS
jgi:hypothetical protein